MTTWTIHEVAAACAVTTGEISQWISRGHFRPSVAVRSGEQRRFDWRDLACLAVMGTLRKQALPMKAISLLTDRLRDDLTGMARFGWRASRLLARRRTVSLERSERLSKAVAAFWPCSVYTTLARGGCVA